jgi:hypothetical protein
MNKIKKEEITKDLIENIMLDSSEVDSNSPESIRKYGERCMMTGILYKGYIKNIDRKSMEKNMESVLSVNDNSNYSEEVKAIMKNIERLSSYRHEYIG